MLPETVESSCPDSSMALIEPDAKLIVQEWNAFVRSGHRPTHVDRPVLHSWQRSRDFGVDPFGGRSELILSRQELEDRLERSRLLIDVARSYMHKIFDAVRDQHHLIYLTDEYGNILDLFGEQADKLAFERHYNFRIGASWNEQAVGTTAVSVALHEDITIPYMSSAKYCYDLKVTSCAAIPLHGEDGDVMGILGIATASRHLSTQIFWMLVSAQMGIENRFRLQRYEADIRVVSQQFQALYNAVSDVVICVDDDGRICRMNSAAEELLNLKSERVSGQQVADVLDFSPLLLQPHHQSDAVREGFLRDSRKRIYPLRHEIAPSPGSAEREHIYIFGNQGAAVRGGREQLTPPIVRSCYQFKDLIGAAPCFVEVKEQAGVAAGCDANVLISGASGTGKEMFAQAIHAAGKRVRGPFVAVNCGAIPKELIESEFFGYASGAFTGADRKGRAGRFEQADGGTLFLDEIGEMPRELQVSLLRVIQDRQVSRIGGTRMIPVDVRVIAATNKQMQDEVRMRNFRSDLFWRLNVIDLQLPTLAERRDDIPLLIDFFIRKHGLQRDDYRMEGAVRKTLLAYSWPGNVRELENTIERVLVFARTGTITMESLPLHIRSASLGDMGAPAVHSLEQGEMHQIMQALQAHEGNISRTARTLGIARNTLYKKMKRHGINCSES